MRALLVLVLIAAVTAPARAADTIVGPRYVTCEKAQANATDLMLSVMWVAGFASAANRTSRADWLEGVTITDIVDIFRGKCEGEKSKTVEQVAIEVVGQLRMAYALRHPSGPSKGK